MRPLVAHVVVPVHDEEDEIGSCLAALEEAAARAASTGVVVRVTVVLDHCRDDSARIVARHPVDLVCITRRCVGAARAAGVARAQEQAPGIPARLVWVATTDGDSQVPVTWLTEQLALAAEGYDLVVGRVRPDLRLGRAAYDAWVRRHRGNDLHVFGASLGFRLSAYEAAGGFEDLPVHEDVSLVDSLMRSGARWTTGGAHVVTSSRVTGRTAGGFAGYLRTLLTETTVPPAEASGL